MKKLLIVALAFLASVAVAQSTPTCANGATQIASGLTGTTFTDTTVVDGQTYFYLATATNQFGASCSNITPAVVIPTTGAHSVLLTWVSSTTSGVTYAVFRAQAPAPPTGLSGTVN